MGCEPDDAALVGLRVLELCRGTAGAYCAKLLADLGADVIKIVDPAALRHEDAPTGAARKLLAARTAYLNTSKRLLATGGRTDRVCELAQEADAVVVDLSDDVLGHYGVVPVDDQVWCTIRPFGASGPYAHFRGTHFTVFHAAAEARLLRPPTEDAVPCTPPMQAGSELGEFDTGVNAAIAVLSAFRSLCLTGAGQRIDVSGQESLLTLNRTSLSHFTNDGVVMQTAPRRRFIGGLMPCQDGSVVASGLNNRQWQALAATEEGACFGRFLEEDGQPSKQLTQELRHTLAEWCADRTKDRVIRWLRVAGCAVAEFADADDLIRSAQLQHREFLRTIEMDDQPLTIPGPPFQLSSTPAQSRPAVGCAEGEGFRRRVHQAVTPSSGRFERPLEGVRVLDFSWLAAGPYATLLLSFLGAEVVKVESSRRIDLARLGFFNRYDGIERSPNFNELNLNKLGVTIDLSDRRGVELVLRLAQQCDVVVDNFRPGVMQRLGLGGHDLLARFPHLIVASSSAFGGTGPDAQAGGTAVTFAAAGGLSTQTGEADGAPLMFGDSIDYRSGAVLAFAIVAAVVNRDRTGRGQQIDLASSEVCAALAPDSLLARSVGSDLPTRIGNGHRWHSPHDVYRADGTDEWVAIAVTCSDEWSALCDIIGRADWSDRFGSVGERMTSRAEIDEAIEAWTCGRSASDVVHLLQARGVPSAPSFSCDQLMVDPHVIARRVFTHVEHPVLGIQTVMRAPWLFSAHPLDIRRSAPLLGEHNEEVLKGMLGLSADDVAACSDFLQ